MTPPALEFQGASFGYRDREVLHGIDFALHGGELVALVGPNGAGKTTLVRGAAGLLQPSAGQVRVDGRSITDLSRQELARCLAVVPQETSPVFSFTALQCVLMGRTPWLSPFQFESRADLDIAEAALEAVGATDLRQRPLAELSGGERRRVVVARALAQQAGILIADEPTAHLDVRHAVALFGLFDQLRRDRALAVLIVTHDLGLAATHCDRVLLVAAGAIVAHGTPAEVFTGQNLAVAFGTGFDIIEDDAGVPRMIAPRRYPL